MEPAARSAGTLEHKPGAQGPSLFTSPQFTNFSFSSSLMTPSSQPRLLQPPAILPGQPWQHGHGHGCGSGLARRLVMRVPLQIYHRSLQQNNEFHVNFICNIIIYNYSEFIMFLRQLAKATTWAALSSIGSSAAIATSTTHAPSRWPKCERMLWV